MYFAAQNGHESVVGRLIAAGAAVDTAMAGGTTPLHVAAFEHCIYFFLKMYSCSFFKSKFGSFTVNRRLFHYHNDLQPDRFFKVTKS